MIDTYVNMYIASQWPLSWMLETETRSKSGCRKKHFGQAQDLENWAAHIHQNFEEYLELKLKCYAI